MDFVSYDIAKKLKEKGFPQDIQHCIGWYPTEYYKNSCIGEYFEGELQEIEDYFGDRISAIHITENEKKGVIAPTISQVLKWLREEKKMYVEPCILADADTDADGKVINEYTYWSFSVTHIETGDMIYFEYERIDDKRFDSYEQAAIAGIEYCLDNLI